MTGGQGASSGAGAQEVERERSTWLPEEQETWAAEQTAPEVLGSAPGSGASAEESELERTVWLGEEPDVWTTGETYTTGTIGDAGPRVDEPKADEEVMETDILNPERLQEMLDAIVTPPEENNDGDVPAPADVFAGLFEGLDDTDEVSEIERLLNG
jgi:hypothetical protein